MKGILGFCLLLSIFLACSKAINTPAGVSGSDTASVTTALQDTIPASISILYGDWLYGTRGYEMPGGLAVVVKNREGILLNGIAISFSAGVNCGFATSYNPITNPVGYVGFYWNLGTSSDSIQTLKVEVKNDTNISVTFHAITLDIKRYRFIGTLRIVDTSANDNGIGYLGPPDFPALSNNMDMPFIVDSLNNIISRLNSPMVVTINGHALTGSAYGNIGNAQGGSLILGGTASENRTYPDATTGQIYSYSESWQFTGSLVNNIYSGSFTLEIDYSTRGAPNPITGNPGDIYNSAYWRYGNFSTTLQ